MLELRRTGMAEADYPAEILACDLDERIDIEALSMPGVQYKRADMWELLNYRDNYGAFDDVVSNGVMSYYVGDLGKVVEKVDRNVLKEGGKFVFDLQLDHWDLRRDALVFNWRTEPPMTLLAGTEEAKLAVEQACEGLDVKIDCHPDSRNEVAVGAVFHVTKK